MNRLAYQVAGHQAKVASRVHNGCRLHPRIESARSAPRSLKHDLRIVAGVFAWAGRGLLRFLKSEAFTAFIIGVVFAALLFWGAMHSRDFQYHGKAGVVEVPHD